MVYWHSMITQKFLVVYPTLAQLEERETVIGNLKHLEVACSSQAGRTLFFRLSCPPRLFQCIVLHITK